MSNTVIVATVWLGLVMWGLMRVSILMAISLRKSIIRDIQNPEKHYLTGAVLARLASDLDCTSQLNPKLVCMEVRRMKEKLTSNFLVYVEQVG